MHEPCGLDAAQRQFYRAIVVLVIAWWQRRKMPARSGNFERARQIAACNLTEDSIARMPRYQRWGLYAIAALTLSGILPMTAAALLGWLCDLVGWWLLIPLYIVVGRVLWRVIWS
nr:MAG TPA: hypothetical protein [Caudoviricetes sp.]